MFNLKSALAESGLADLDFDELDDLLRKIRREHLADISPEIGVRELLEIAQRENWIVEDNDGKFRIQTPVIA